MASPAEKQILKNTRTIILFYSNRCGHCLNYKEENWPNLVKAAPKNVIIREIDVGNPEDDDVMSYHKQNGVPNTVFLNCKNNILISNPGNFDTSRLVQEFKKMTTTNKSFGFAAEYR